MKSSINIPLTRIIGIVTLLNITIIKLNLKILLILTRLKVKAKYSLRTIELVFRLAKEFKIKFCATGDTDVANQLHYQ
jgi:hypothetical protein